MAMLANYSNLLLSIYRDAQDQPVSEFQDRALSALRATLSFDSSMWGHGVMREPGIDIHSIHLHNSPPEMLIAYDKVKHQDEAAVMVTQVPNATLAFNAGTLFQVPARAGMRQLCAEFGHEHFWISCDINPLTKFAQWISLYRKDPMQVCTPEETQFFSVLAPHLMQALAINRKLHLDRLLGDTAREKWTVAIADPRGYYYHVDAGFLELIQRDWSTRKTEVLPPALLGVLLRDQNTVIGKHVAVKAGREHGLLYLKARPRVPVDQLSPRELLVAKLLANGLTQREVAEKLGRSLDTVRSHVRSAFIKLDIRSVVALAQHLALAE